VSVTLSVNSSTVQTPQRIFTVDILKDADLYIHLYSPKTVEICELYSYTKINNMLK